VRIISSAGNIRHTQVVPHRLKTLARLRNINDKPFILLDRTDLQILEIAVQELAKWDALERLVR
jgi:hypothetical protein